MKRIATLLFCIGTVTVAFAQPFSQGHSKYIIHANNSNKKTDKDPRNSRNINIGGERRIYDEQSTNYSSYDNREREIEQINREYDAKIRSVRNNNRLSKAEEDRIIRNLETDRARAIRDINNRYSTDDRYDDYKENKKVKKAKSNNGNHYGWEKGKGNPHKKGNYSKRNSNKKGKN